MTQSLSRVPRHVFAPVLCLLCGCAQGMVSIPPSTVLSTVVLIGGSIGGHTTTRGSGPAAPSGVSIPRSPAPTAAASRVLQTADRYVGIPYVWGGNTPQSGFDCSGFTRYVFAQHGVQLPRTAREQAHSGEPVAVDFGALRPGDILLFAEPNEAISHVAIYVGDGRMIHASSARGEVGYLDLGGDRAAWYIQNMVAVRRLTRAD